MSADIFVDVDAVIVPRKRLRNANHIEELAASISKNGLLHAITLRRDGDRLVLVAGKRRLDAAKHLKQGKIRARVLDVTETEALLIEIDENLQRAELTVLEHGQHIAERKKVWEALHPETKHGGAPGKRVGKGGKAKPDKQSDSKDAESASLLPDESNGESAPSFVEETARATQASQRTIQVSAQIGENICRKAQQLLEGTPVADRKTDLLKIARLPKDDQVAVAKLIHDGKAPNYHRAKRLVDAEKIAAEPQPLPTGPFRVIVADPPWSYEKRDDDASKRETTPYATMTLDEIKALPVVSLADDDSVLWLWATNAHLPEAFGVARAWGFTYKVLLTWDKGRPGMGDWLRGQTEHCLLCVRGKPIVTLAGQTTILRETRTEHSRKPEAFYRLVGELCPGSKVELFARSAREGWTSWGAELPAGEGTLAS